MPLAKRQWMMRLTLALWLLATFGSPSVGWGQPKYGGTLVMVHTDPDLMNPVATPGWLQFQRMSFNGLIDYDAQGNIVPSVATSWEISEDGLTYTFQLRQDVKWHDGKALTAGDVQFTYEKILDPQIASRFNLNFQAVQDVQAPSPSTVVITLKQPDPVFLAHLWAGIIPRHIWEKEDFAKSQYNVRPVGSGPWKLKEWVRGDHMIFEANPDYFQGRPYLDRIIVKVIPDATVAFAALEKGDVDYFPFTGVIGGPPYQLVNRLKQSKHLEVKVFDVVSTQRLFFRNGRPSIISRPGKQWPTPSTSDSSSRSCCSAMARSRTVKCRQHCNGAITPMCRNTNTMWPGPINCWMRPATPEAQVASASGRASMGTRGCEPSCPRSSRSSSSR